jgi:hypothetical protein
MVLLLDAHMRPIKSLATLMKLIREQQQRLYGQQPRVPELLKPQAPPDKDKGK